MNSCNSKGSERILIILFLLSIAALISISAGVPRAYSFPRDIGKLRGKVKFLFIYGFEIKKDSLNRSAEVLKDKSFVAFHDSGSSILTDRIRTDFSIEEFFCNYDHHGNLMEIKTTELAKNDDRLTIYHTTHTYDIKDREVETVETGEDASSLLSKTSYAFFADKVIKSSYDDKGSLRKMDTSTYYKSTDRFSNLFYPHNDRHSEKEVEQGPDYMNVNTYAHFVDLIESKQYKPKDSLQTEVTYDYTSDRDIQSVYIYKKNMLVNKTFHRYIYDSVHNWTTDSIFEMDTLSHIIIRKFEYY
jgi:hypothetical protein